MSGSGTASDPYKIYYPDQLHQVRNYLNQSGVYFKLMNDIDITEWNEANNPGQGWEPIGVQSAPFKGVFDGNNKKITGFSITRGSTDYVGFFGYIDGATVKNLTIEGPVTGHSYVGAIVGYGTGNCTLSGLTHNGAITAYSYAGHIVGYYSSSISSATATGNLSCTAGSVGGIVGFQTSSGTTISNVQVTGNITGSSSSAHYIGGIVGYSLATISNATYSGDIVSTGYYVGGISGNSYGAVSSARVSGSVKGKCYVGGICGKSYRDITNCYSYGNVTGIDTYVGGVVGRGLSSITKSASFGNVSGGTYVGGVIGYFGADSSTDIPEFQFVSCKEKDGYQYIAAMQDKFIGISKGSNKSILNCYAVGNVTSTNNYAGGICGYVNIASVQWNKTNGRYLDLSSTDYDNFVKKKGITNRMVSGRYTCFDYSAVVSSLNVCDNYFNGILQGKDYVGGIVGYGTVITVTRNYSNATINGATHVGGIIGDIESDSESVQYYPSDSSTPTTAVSSTATESSILKSNMAINSAVIATSDAGRIYGSIAANGVTVGANGNAAEDNRALYEGRLVISGVTQELVDNEQNGVNNGVAYFKLKANYVSHGWDFNNNWKNLETESFPYKSWQAAPPTISSNLVSGETSISGNSVDGGTVYVAVGNNAEVSTTCSGTAWTLTGLPALTSAALVSFYTKVSGKENSYRSQATVSFPGSGTEADPWRVYTAGDLQGVYKPGYYKQMNDINLASWISANSSTKGWVPVGYNGTDPIVYDGDNHKVTGLWVNSTDDYSGLFSRFSKGTIRNLTVQATAKQVKGGNNVGIVIGKIGQGTIENVTATGNVSAKGNVGGIAGYTTGTTLKNLSYTGQLTATGSVGGITSYATTAVVTECEVKEATIKGGTGSQYVGGLVAHSLAPISKCNVSGTITLTGSSNTEDVGGLVGNSSKNITDCSVSGAITLTGTSNEVYVGGLAGQVSTNSITKCSTDMTISSASSRGQAAGLIAHGNGTMTIKLCSAAGSVTSTGSDSYTGGLVAYTSSTTTIEDCYSTANVTGTKWTAGLVAYNYGTVNRCYASGNVSSVYYGAGLVGENDGSSAITTNSVALGTKVEVSDQTGWGIRVVGNFKNNAPEPSMENLFAWQGMQVSVNGVPKSIPDNNLDGTAITTAQTKNSDTYESLYWDFDEVWTMSADGYPYLKWQAMATVTKGDLNGDGEVSITDVVLIIDVIAGEITDASKVEAADVNGDGEVTITDCVAAIDLIAAQQSSGAPMLANRRGAMANSDFITASMEENLLNVALENEHSYTAFQMVVSMPANMTLGKATMDELRGAGHQVMVRNLGNGQYLVAGFSMDNEMLTGNNGRLLSITTNGKATGDIVISNIEFSTAEAEGYRLANVTINSTTGIDENWNMRNGDSETIYDLQGRRVSTPTKGLYIINGKKVNIK